MRIHNNPVILFLSFAVFLAAACQKTPSIRDVIALRATSSQVLADGSRLDTFYADLPINSVAANRAVTFQVSSGLFSNGFDTITVWANRTDIDPNKITAIAIFQTSTRPGPDTVNAATNTTPQVVNQMIIDLSPSLVDSILLTPSAYSVPDSFGISVNITALLFDSTLGRVSQGATISFSDYSGSQPGGGTFLPQSLLISDTSQVIVSYTPSQTDTAGQLITIVATVPNAVGGTMATGKVVISIIK